MELNKTSESLFSAKIDHNHPRTELMSLEIKEKSECSL